ncbi:hypothetical protein M405DRAFT_818627 [Rhizopogon salebrosus TDB-379]|nr:hypothetical protein M405DRAFT_818627 [Rhizopogon salebrosus TDB-379]
MLPVWFYLLLTNLVYVRSHDPSSKSARHEGKLPTLLLPQYKQTVRRRWIHLRMVILLMRIHRYKDRQGYYHYLSLDMAVNPCK